MTEESNAPASGTPSIEIASMIARSRDHEIIQERGTRFTNQGFIPGTIAYGMGSSIPFVSGGGFLALWTFSALGMKMTEVVLPGSRGSRESLDSRLVEYADTMHHIRNIGGVIGTFGATLCAIKLGPAIIAKASSAIAGSAAGTYVTAAMAPAVNVVAAAAAPVVHVVSGAVAGTVAAVGSASGAMAGGIVVGGVTLFAATSLVVRNAGLEKITPQKIIDAIRKLDYNEIENEFKKINSSDQIWEGMKKDLQEVWETTKGMPKSVSDSIDKATSLIVDPAVQTGERYFALNSAAAGSALILDQASNAGIVGGSTYAAMHGINGGFGAIAGWAASIPASLAAGLLTTGCAGTIHSMKSHREEFEVFLDRKSRFIRFLEKDENHDFKQSFISSLKEENNDIFSKYQKFIETYSPEDKKN